MRRECARLARWPIAWGQSAGSSGLAVVQLSGQERVGTAEDAALMGEAEVGGDQLPTWQLVICHTDAEREYAYDRDPVLGSGTGQVLAAADGNWTVIDMAADWSTVHPGPA